MIDVGIKCRLEDKGVHADGDFKQILKHRLFADAREDENASLNHLISIYVERQFTLYQVGTSPQFTFAERLGEEKESDECLYKSQQPKR